MGYLNLEFIVSQDRDLKTKPRKKQKVQRQIKKFVQGETIKIVKTMKK